VLFPAVGYPDQVAVAGDAGGGQLGHHLGHVRVDHLLAGSYRDGDAVVAVLDEVQAADAVHLDRRDHHAVPSGLIDQLPALPVPVRGGPEPAVEAGRLLGGSDYRVQPDGPQPQGVFAAESQHADDLVEPQQAGIVRFAAQPADQLVQHMPPAGPGEIVRRVYPRHAGVKVPRPT
jgi:hypothetical protein